MLTTILVFGLVLSLLVFIHELGHFLVAKKIGVRVEEFGFGLPPRIWGVRRGETIYSINWLPIGGFVKLSGEDEEENQNSELKSQNSKELRRYFFARSKKERAAVLLAGVAMNFVLAVVIVSFIFTRGVFVPTDRVHIEKIVENSPAAAAGLLTGDIVQTVAGQAITSDKQLVSLINDRGENETSLTLLRNGQKLEKKIIPKKETDDQGRNVWRIGIVISSLEERRYPWYQAPFYGLLETLKMSYLMLISLGALLYRLITFQSVGVDVAGPIGIAQATGEAVKYGFLAVLQLTGILSLNLAIINALPIPALDGGRLLFVVLEKFIGRRVKPKAERIAHQIGMVFLLALIALVTVNDILRLIRG